MVTKGIDVVSEYNRKRMLGLGKPNPYLTGVNEPMTSEETLEGLRVTASIPGKSHKRTHFDAACRGKAAG